ncbi:MFS transporter [Rhodospirillaceae bacterium SYSU D60014]|uniref:MFS transporter n=1 Tax=Virgifigura deserti TaxID=2268457 RepID=UPI000E675D37
MRSRARGFDHVRVRARLIGMLTAIVTASVLALGLTAITAFDRAVAPELANRTRLIGSIIRSEVQRSLQLGIPFDALAGLDRYLSETLEQFSEVDYISVNTASGSTVAEARSPTGRSLLEQTGLGKVVGVQRNTFSLPILVGNELVGAIVVEVSPQFVETRLRDVFLDVVVIALVASLVALELALAVAVSSVGKPFDRIIRLLSEQREGNFVHCIPPGGLSGLGRAASRLNDQAADLAERLAALPSAARIRITGAIDARISEGRPVRLRLSDFNDIRLALFLFTLATAIANSFLPLYARAAVRPNWLSPEMAAAAPFLLYLVAVAALSPFGGRMARRLGPRRLFLASVPLTALALMAMGLSDSVAGISFWHAATGGFFALATIACHEYAIRAAGDGRSARPAGALVAVVFGGVFGGSALGGVLAGRFGFEAAFFAGAAIAILSGAIAITAMMGRAGDSAASRSTPIARVTKRRFTARFLALLIGITAPMNAITAILVWYLTPLMLAASGHGPAEIARVVMLYYLAVVLFGPTVTHLSDGRLGPIALVVIGSAVSGLAVLSIGLWDSVWAITVAVAGVGLGHTLIRAPQYTLAISVTDGVGGNLDALRVVERLGALLGLAVSATFLRDIGTETILRISGIVVLTGTAAFAIIAGHVRWTRPTQKLGRNG